MNALNTAAVPASAGQILDAVMPALIFVMLGVLPVFNVVAGWRRRRAMTPAEREREDQEDADHWEDRHW